MNFKNIFQKKEKRNLGEQVFSSTYGTVNFNRLSSYEDSKSLKLSAVYRSVELISNGIANLQLKPYAVDAEGFKTEQRNNNLYNLLTIEPEANISKYIFFKQLLQYVLLRGNGYAKIIRDENFNVIEIQLLNSDLVTPQLTVDNEIRYMVTYPNSPVEYINRANMIHIINYPSCNGLLGISTIWYAHECLTNCYDSEEHANNYFLGGANTAGFLFSDKMLSDKQISDIKESIVSQGDNDLKIISNNTALKYQPVNVSPKDLQLIESRQFNIINIARFFSVDPVLLFSDKGSFATSEQATLSFLNTTLLSFIEKIENEFNRKLILPSERNNLQLKFDLSNLLRVNKDAQATYYTKMFQIGAYSTNEIRRELGMSKLEDSGADKHFIQVNLQDMNNLIVTKANSVDNKIL